MNRDEIRKRFEEWHRLPHPDKPLEVTRVAKGWAWAAYQAGQAAQPPSGWEERAARKIAEEWDHAKCFSRIEWVMAILRSEMEGK